MMVNNSFSRDHNKNCLTDDDLFLYISRTGDSEKLGRIEAHSAGCPECRRALAEVLELLQADTGQPIEEIQEPDNQELEKTIDLIHEIARKERSAFKHIYRKLQLPVAAALFLGIALLAFWGWKDYNERNKAEGFYLQAKAKLEQRYSGTSNGNLRLSMPFNPAPMDRNADDRDLLRESENLFHRALAVREDLDEAHLGLGYIHLNESEFESAAEEFQALLDYRNGDVQALIGRGVARYEEALQSDDPLRYRSLLDAALDDFDAALKNNPDSAEALYNKIWVLFESGLHKEALEYIEKYLSRDKESVWAEELKRLRVRIRANSATYVEKEIQRAALTRDPSAMEEIARYAPHQMPAAIWTAMRNSLALEGAEEIPGNPNSEDLKWVAGIMESGYTKVTGDRSFLEMIEFYRKLSPSQRLQKKTSDGIFETLKKLLEQEDYKTILHRSVPLEKEYSKLQDFWQLYNIYQLRGTCFYMEGDFERAYEELSEMLRNARRIDSPELVAMSLGNLFTVKSQQDKFDESMRFADELKDIVETHNLDAWSRYTGIKLGSQYLRLGKYDLSLKENTAALKSARRFADVNIIAAALQNIGIIMDRLGNLRDAKYFYDSALRTVEDHLSKKPERGVYEFELRRRNLNYSLGELSLRTGDTVTAVSHFQNCLESIPSGMNQELQARNRIGLVEAFLIQSRNEEAGTMLERVMAASPQQYPEIEWKAWLFKGRLQEDAGDFSGALASYQKAIDIVEGIRSDIDSINLRRSFFSECFDPYREIIGLLYQNDGSRQMSLEYVDRAKSMTLREYLNLPDSGNIQNEDPKAPGDSGNPFRVLEYFFLQDKLLVFVTDPEGRIIETASKELSGETVSIQVREFQRSVRENDITGFNELSHQLYDDLIAPVENHLSNGHEGPLVILPDGPLHLLPFAGLRDDQGRFLIEKKPVVYAPSRSVFYHCLAQARNIPAGNNRDVVLIDGTQNLASAREELVHLYNLFKSRAKLLGINDLSEFRKEVSDSDILHFSGHSVSKDGEPVLLLQQFPREEFLDSREIGTWKLPQCRLVNLAGCSTGIGPISEGESPWGLVPAFLNAGTPAIVASLMQVDDTSTKILTRRFYELLNAGADKATALQKAQIALLTQSPDEIKNLSWLPYILIGDPL